MCFKGNSTITNEHGGRKEGGLREEKCMTRMKISNSLLLEAWLRETIFYSAVIDMCCIHSKYDLKCKNPEFDLLPPPPPNLGTTHIWITMGVWRAYLTLLVDGWAGKESEKAQSEVIY